jgi:hypothetical protein
VYHPRVVEGEANKIEKELEDKIEKEEEEKEKS